MPDWARQMSTMERENTKSSRRTGLRHHHYDYHHVSCWMWKSEEKKTASFCAHEKREQSAKKNRLRWKIQPVMITNRCDTSFECPIAIRNQMKKSNKRQLRTLMIRVNVVRLSSEKFSSVGSNSSRPRIRTGIEQTTLAGSFSSSLVSNKPKAELEHDMTQEYVCSSSEPLIQSEDERRSFSG